MGNFVDTIFDSSETFYRIVSRYRYASDFSTCSRPVFCYHDGGDPRIYRHEESIRGGNGSSSENRFAPAKRKLIKMRLL